MVLPSLFTQKATEKVGLTLRKREQERKVQRFQAVAPILLGRGPVLGLGILG